LQDRALDLVDQPVGIDHLAAVDGGHRAHQPRTAALPVYLDLAGNGAVCRQILGTRERKAIAAAGRRLLALLPSERLCGLFDHVAPAPVAARFTAESSVVG